MALSSFHLFSHLPCELRLQIWELSIRPTGYDGGLHHFIITNVSESHGIDTKSLAIMESPDPGAKCYWDQSAIPKISLPGDSPAISSKQSVYFWDAGLWTACKESRNVMMKHCQKLQLHEKTLCYTFGKTINVCRPALLTVPEDGQNWDLMVQPYQDLFCFTPIHWDLEIGWECILTRHVFSTWTTGGFGPARHLAIELDPSWNLHWPESFSELYHEPSARGFVARMVEELCCERICCSIWLIDRSTTTPQASACRRPACTTPRIFHDLNTEYIETAREVILQYALGEKMDSLSFFISKLAYEGEEWYEDAILKVSDEYELYMGGWFNIDPYLGVLTVRDLEEYLEGAEL